MLLVIFGAGASYDSIPALPPPRQSVTAMLRRGQEPGREEFRPPLASQLFAGTRLTERLQRSIPTLLDIVDQLARPREGETIEDVLQRLLAEAATYPRRYRQLMAARLYIRELLYTCEEQWNTNDPLATNHIALLDHIEQWRGGSGPHPALVTFNYDRLIESAMRYRGIGINSIAEYHAPGQPTLLKLHGSVDWVRPLREKQSDVILSRGPAAEYLVRTADAQPELGEIEILDGLSLVSKSGHVCAPAIALPYRGKDFECPPTHLSVLEELLPRVRAVLAIGWSAAEEHFLTKLRDALPFTAVFMTANGSDEWSRDTCARLQGAGVKIHPNGWQPFAGGFSSLVRSPELTKLLRYALR